jgi:hypothetical protein
VRDNSRAHFDQVQSLLGHADFGADFEPTKLDSAIRDFAYSKAREKTPSLLDSFERESHTMNVEDCNRSADNLRQKSSTIHPDQTLSSAAVGAGAAGFSSDVAASSKADVRKDHSSSSVDGGGSKADSRKQKLKAFSQSALRVSSALSSQKIHSLENEISSLEVSDMPSLVKLSSDGLPSQNSTQPGSPLEGFRNDLYGVKHSELLNKILVRKEKLGTRPSLQLTLKENTSDLEPNSAAQSAAKTDKQKLVNLLKKAKAKGKARPTSDFDYLTEDDKFSSTSNDIVDDEDWIDDEKTDLSRKRK